MAHSSTTTVEPKKGGERVHSEGSGDVPRPPQRPGSRGFFTQYKPEQGKVTRTSSWVGLVLIIAWGAKFIDDRLAGYQGDEGWNLLVTPGVAILAAVICGALSWRLTFVSRGASDFMIATEGEMKKVSWSSRREVIGSTKVVILFTVLLAGLLFLVDLLFQKVFQGIGVLKL